ncbi:MAG: hypothetical protein H6719_14450 [Sandaracinaceae bacterium]|nr:hypothetical protein [Sandaracinaceae bacterium]
MTERYPLEAARVVRAGARERAEQILARARRELEVAREVTIASRDALERFRAEASERRARASAPTTGAALLRERAYGERLSAEEARRVRELAGAHAEERRAARAVRDARRELGSAHAEEQVVNEHRERWDQRRRREAERAEEEELEETSRA